MNPTAITYPYVTVNELTGERHQGAARRHLRQPVQPRSLLPAGRRHGAGRRHALRCDPTQRIGNRISNMTLNGKPIAAGKRYKVASWAPVAEGASGEPVWEVVARYLRDKKVSTVVVLPDDR